MRHTTHPRPRLALAVTTAGSLLAGALTLSAAPVGAATTATTTVERTGMSGYRVVWSNENVNSFGAPFLTTPTGPAVVAATSTADGSGVWLISAAGAVTPRGSAPALGSPRPLTLNRPVVGAASTPGTGTWLVA